jgi:hypothetical protein
MNLTTCLVAKIEISGVANPQWKCWLVVTCDPHLSMGELSPPLCSFGSMEGMAWEGGLAPNRQHSRLSIEGASQRFSIPT